MFVSGVDGKRRGTEKGKGKGGDGPWPGVSSLPLWSKDGKGLPLAKRARPSVYFIASSKVHSELAEGLESGKMMGCWFHWPILVRIDESKTPPMVDSPIRMVGWT